MAPCKFVHFSKGKPLFGRSQVIVGYRLLYTGEPSSANVPVVQSPSGNGGAVLAQYCKWRIITSGLCLSIYNNHGHIHYKADREVHSFVPTQVNLTLTRQINIHDVRAIRPSGNGGAVLAQYCKWLIITPGLCLSIYNNHGHNHYKADREVHSFVPRKLMLH
ncbi:hypothetical protein J6590_002272 [Homalodisca vitripennis]|nr:hypothetical protein J6590_002272 [Homalodisca vitripennis]